MADKDILAEEREAFELHAEAMNENQAAWIDDVRFSRLAEQWPEAIKKQRELEHRPVLTINRMPSFIRQIVNDSRQNKPQIKVKPVDNSADRYTADVIEGLVRNIEYTSKADVAYDTAVDHAVSGGFGYMRVAIDYEYDDSFDKGLRIRRVANPLTVFPDPFSTEADSSDWNRCFIIDDLSEDEFKTKYKGADQVDWDDLGYTRLETPWKQEDKIRVAESWFREQVDKPILLMPDGSVIGADVYKSNIEYFQMMGMQPVNQRTAKGYKITQRIMTGAEIIETNEWAGSYIPVIPVYGEELNIEGKRYFRSLIRDAKDAQRMLNYWRTTSTELVALAPRVPYIGEEGFADVDTEKWLTSNSQSHAFMQYKRGSQPPQRQPLDSGTAAGAMTEAMTAADDLKSIMGMYDASLGAKSNETSGKAIMARQQEGDTSSYHFIDNLARGIRHTACVLIDLIPKVYTSQRVIRIIGVDGTEQTANVAPGGRPQIDPQTGKLMQGVQHVYDLSVGKYDVAVEVGPGYTTKRQEAAAQMVEMFTRFPQGLAAVADIVVKSLDWPQADEMAERFKAMMGQQGGDPQAQQAIQQGQQQNAQLQGENQQLKTKQAANEGKLLIDAYKAETERLGKVMPFLDPAGLSALGLDTAANAMNSPDIMPAQMPNQGPPNQ